MLKASLSLILQRINKFNLNKNTCICLPHRQTSSRIHQIIEFKVTKSSLCGGNKEIDKFIAPSTSSPLHKICLKKQMLKSVGNDYIYQSDSSSSEVIFSKIRHFIISTFHPFLSDKKYVFMRQKVYKSSREHSTIPESFLWTENLNLKRFSIQDFLIAL